jgi:hypothetical protein
MISMYFWLLPISFHWEIWIFCLYLKQMDFENRDKKICEYVFTVKNIWEHAKIHSNQTAFKELMLPLLLRKWLNLETTWSEVVQTALMGSDCPIFNEDIVMSSFISHPCIRQDRMGQIFDFKVPCQSLTAQWLYCC